MRRVLKSHGSRPSLFKTTDIFVANFVLVNSPSPQANPRILYLELSLNESLALLVASAIILKPSV